jgi:hypothetical protein
VNVSSSSANLDYVDAVEVYVLYTSSSTLFIASSDAFYSFAILPKGLPHLLKRVS